MNVHNSEQNLFDLLKEKKIDTNDSCSQSYDNAGTLLNKCWRFKVGIKEPNEIVDYVSYLEHSQNLIGKCVIEHW